MSGLKKRVEYLLKHSPLIQVLYRKGMSFAFQTLGLFVRRDEKLILLSASGGRKYTYLFDICSVLSWVNGRESVFQNFSQQQLIGAAYITA